eukprot:EG_transcript_19070
MGMKPNASGALEPVDGYVEERMQNITELQHPTMPAWVLRPLHPIMDSSSMGPKDWLRIATEIEKSYLDYAGFVVIMGTDTMTYAASALSFLLVNLAKPIIFTGSMIPFAHPWNDARRNLIVSILFATCAELCEVCIYFGGRLLRANRTRKISNGDVRAFASPNFPPLGELSASRFGSHGEIKLNRHLLLPRPRGRLLVHHAVHSNILVLRANPGCQWTDIRVVLECAPGLQALVLEMYGTDHSRMKRRIIDLLRAAVARGTIVVLTTQCLRGAVEPGEDGMMRAMLGAGAIFTRDMTTEAIVTKLGVLLGSDRSVEEVKDLMQAALCGEITVGPSAASKL